MIRIASFDIGICNFSQYVEDVDTVKIRELEEKYKNLPKSLQRRVKGEMNEQIEELLQETYMTGTRVTTGVYNFTTGTSQGLDIQVRKGLLAHLSKFEKVWKTCDIFVIEQQYFNTSSFPGKKRVPPSSVGGANVDAIRTGEATFMWLLERFPDTTIMYFGSQFKTQILGAPFKMSKPERKKWSTEKAKSVYTDRGDQDMIELFKMAEDVKHKRFTSKGGGEDGEKIQAFIDKYPLQSQDAKELAYKIVRDRQKLDDISDSLTQLQAFKFKTMIGCF